MNHAETVKKLVAIETMAAAYRVEFNTLMHERFQHGYCLIWMHNGHLQAGHVIGVLGCAEDGLNYNRLRVYNRRTRKTVDIEFWQIREAQEIEEHLN